MVEKIHKSHNVYTSWGAFVRTKVCKRLLTARALSLSLTANSIAQDDNPVREGRCPIIYVSSAKDDLLAQITHPAKTSRFTPKGKVDVLVGVVYYRER